jgi:hypothetical protein
LTVLVNHYISKAIKKVRAFGKPKVRAFETATAEVPRLKMTTAERNRNKTTKKQATPEKAATAYFKNMQCAAGSDVHDPQPS